MLGQVARNACRILIRKPLQKDNIKMDTKEIGSHRNCSRFCPVVGFGVSGVEYIYVITKVCVRSCFF
jgi:hypothetical protein